MTTYKKREYHGMKDRACAAMREAARPPRRKAAAA